VLTITSVPAGPHAAEFDILDGLAHGAENDWAVAHELFDCLRCELGMLCQQGPLLGVIAQIAHGGGQLIAGGVGSCHQQGRREHGELVGGESVPVVFGADQFRDQVVGEVVAPLGDHVVEVGVELVSGRHDDRLVVDDVPVEDLEDVIGPVGEQLPVAARSAEQLADDRNWIPACDVGDDVAAPRGGDWVDQLGDDPGDRGL
jgi:hypothetical protein